MSKPDLVLLHGWGMHGGIWGDFGTLLAEHFTLHCLDLPGYGGTEPCDPHDLESVTAAVMAQLPNRCHLMGWSLGGMVATRIAALAPERVRKLVLVGSSPRFCQEEGWADGMAPGVLDAFEATLKGDPRATLHRFLAVQALGGEDAKAQTVLLKRYLADRPLPNDATLKAGLDILRNGDIRPLVPDLNLPVCLIYGEKDTVVPPGAGHYLQTHLGRSRLYLMAGCAHAPFLTMPEEVAALVKDFLTGAA